VNVIGAVTGKGEEYALGFVEGEEEICGVDGFRGEKVGRECNSCDDLFWCGDILDIPDE
jgi:hypothetical protein